MTILEVIQRSSDFLAKRGVESPRLQTELLLAHALQLPRLKLYLNFERTLNSTFPTLTDTKIKGWKRKLMELTGTWRYKTAFYFAPYELLVMQRLLRYRQPEIEGFAFED